MIEITHLSKAFGEKQVLCELSLTIADNEKLAIRGESGKGKTTLLRMIAGLEKADHGKITGCSTSDIAYMFQEARLFENLTALENVAVVLPSYPKAEAMEKASTYLDAVGLLADRHKKPSELSGGMRQRVALARTLCAERPILLLDEPFSALDKETKAAMLALVKAHADKRTLILVTHSAGDSAFLCDREVVL